MLSSFSFNKKLLTVFALFTSLGLLALVVYRGYTRPASTMDPGLVYHYSTGGYELTLRFPPGWRLLYDDTSGARFHKTAFFNPNLVSEESAQKDWAGTIVLHEEELMEGLDLDCFASHCWLSGARRDFFNSLLLTLASTSVAGFPAVERVFRPDPDYSPQVRDLLMVIPTHPLRVISIILYYPPHADSESTRAVENDFDFLRLHATSRQLEEPPHEPIGIRVERRHPAPSASLDRRHDARPGL